MSEPARLLIKRAILNTGLSIEECMARKRPTREEIERALGELRTEGVDI